MRAKKRKNNLLTTDLIRDRMLNSAYRKLKRGEERHYIKKAKLSYYYDVDDKTKKEYLEYYMEEFPDFKEDYLSSNEKTRNILLEEAINKSKEYRDLFLCNNLRLVFKVAKHYRNADEIENLYQEGFTGMMRALQKFDLSKNTRFSTYAIIWIRQAITRYIYDHGSLIDIPINKREKISKLDAYINECQNRGIVPTDEMIAKKLNISLEELSNILLAKKQLNPRSLNEPINGAEDTSEIEEFIASDDPDFSDIVDSDIMRETFINSIEVSGLTDREKEIIYLRYGFYDGKKHTLDEIGKKYKVTRERIRQIESASLKKLRNNIRLLEYYKEISEGSFLFLEGHSEIEKSKILQKYKK